MRCCVSCLVACCLLFGVRCSLLVVCCCNVMGVVCCVLLCVICCPCFLFLFVLFVCVLRVDVCWLLCRLLLVVRYVLLAR